MKKQLKRSLWLICCLCAMYTLYSCKQETTAEMKLWYNRPATNWMKSALPIGNGELGAMFFGGISHEQLQFNEKSLWSGSPELRGAYQSFGDVFLDFEGIDSCEVENYYRELSLDEAIGRVTFDCQGVTYEREYFASYPDCMIVARLITPGNKGKLSFSVILEYNPYPFIIRTLGRLPDFEVTNCQPFLLLYSALICFLGISYVPQR